MSGYGTPSDSESVTTSTTAGAFPFAQRHSKSLEWSGITYSVTQKNEVKTILKSTSGVAPGGKVTAILGPSGAGKSSLLNLLAGRVVPSKSSSITGRVTVDGKLIHPIKYRKKIAYVMQEDALPSALTPREALAFSAALRTTVTKEKRAMLVESMLQELGLEQCADTRIGNQLVKGISGGERKRTSVGVELVTNPSLLFLDEPTSGLDSFSARSCIQVLRRIAEAGSTVMCSIHQPSSEVLSLFDQIVLLKDGHIVYQGPLKKMSQAFSAAKFPVPANYNPADHILHVAQSNSVDTLRSANLIKDSATVSGPSSFAMVRENSEHTDVASHRADRTTGVLTQLRWLFVRDVKTTYRDVGSLVARFGVSGFLAILISLIFKGIGNRDDSVPDHLEAHFGSMTFVAINVLFGVAQTPLLTFPLERPVFLREYASGMYSSFSYFVSKVLTELPISFMQVLMMVSIMYWSIEFQGNFIAIVVSLWLLGSSATSISIFLGSVLSDAKTAQEAMPVVFVPQIMFAGFFIRTSSIPVFLRWAQYLCSLKYGLNLFMIAEFDDCNTDQAVCDHLLDDNGVDDDMWYLYAAMLVALFLGFRMVGLLVLRHKAKAVFTA